MGWRGAMTRPLAGAPTSTKDLKGSETSGAGAKEASSRVASQLSSSSTYCLLGPQYLWSLLRCSCYSVIFLSAETLET